MATKKFPSELASRGSVKATDKLIIHNIDTGATEYTTVAELFRAISLGVGMTQSVRRIDVGVAQNETDGIRITYAPNSTTEGLDITYNAANADINIDALYTIGSILFRTKTASTPITALELETDGDAVFYADVSAATFTDRTPFYEGDALSEIKNIKGKDGKIDHSTLPSFARVQKVRNVYEKKIMTKKGEKVVEMAKVGEKVSEERDLGAMISILVKATVQLSEENKALSDRLAKLEKK